jgi:hypothetical protein
VRTSDRNRHTLPLSMHEVGCISNTNARADRDEKR